MLSSVLSLSLPLGLLSLGFFLFHRLPSSSRSASTYQESIESDGALPLRAASLVRGMETPSSVHHSRHPSFFHREILKNSSVTCNDGTTAGYFIRSNPKSKRWLVFLEGGWHCYSQVSCHQRWIRARPLMTSAHWPQMRSMGGILSLDQEENPFWSDANHVLIPYCSSDSWSGSRPARNPGDFSFMGTQIIEQVMIDLLPRGLKEADFLLLAGSSAGAVGVLINLDRVSDLMHRLGTRVQVRGLADSGWFLDNEPYSEPSNSNNQIQAEMTASELCETSPHSCPPVESIKLGLSHWNGQVPSSCAREYPGEEWKCYFGYRIYRTLKTPLFVVQWIFDEAQMTVDNVGSPVTRSHWSYIHKLGKELRKSLENVTALFAPSCVSHTLLTKRSWTETRVNHISLPHALHCWEQQTLSSNDSRQDDQQEVKTISSFNNLFVTQSPSSIREDVESNPSSVLSVDTFSLSHTDKRIERNNKRRHVPSTLMSSSLLDLPLRDHINNNNNERQHHPVLMQQDQISVIVSNMESTSDSPSSSRSMDVSLSLPDTSNRMTKIHHHVIPGFSQENPSPPAREHTHIELIEEKKRPPTVSRESRRKRKRKRKHHHHRRRHNNNNNSNRSNDHSLLNNNSFKAPPVDQHHALNDRSSKNNILFREIIDSISSVNSNNHQLLNSRRDEDHQQQPTSNSINKQETGNVDNNPPHNNKQQQQNSITDSSKEETCRYKLIDHCSWAQCNRGCPRLYNPLTGKEMNFIDLFKTLGLDMSQVAGALGMDTTTLQRLDHEALLQLLTH